MQLGAPDAGTGATAVAVGDFHSCAILQDQSVRCWGDNRYAQLGQGNADAGAYLNLSPNAIDPVSLGATGKAVDIGLPGEPTPGRFPPQQRRALGRQLLRAT